MHRPGKIENLLNRPASGGRQPTEESGRSTFSLALLLRVVSLIAGGSAWSAAVIAVTPDAVALATTVLGTVLATIVGIRRFGSVLNKCLAAMWFFVGSTAMAAYSGFIAFAIQLPEAPVNYPWAFMDRWFFGFWIVVGLPLMIIIVVLMLRAWTWSANDVLIHRRCREQVRNLTPSSTRRS